MPLAVAHDPAQSPACGPPAVAVHDDRHVAGKLLGLEPDPAIAPVLRRYPGLLE